MKTQIVALALLVGTATAVTLYPVHRSDGATSATATVAGRHPRIEAVFVLDTTGSMSGMIQAAKEKIWSVASTMALAQPAPEIKLGLIAYRDRGDVYVTRRVDLSRDLDSVYASLMEFQAGGGGDGPESVNRALYEAVHDMSWSQDPETYKVVFLVGDAPPHQDYQDDVRYPETVAVARARGITVNTIQCGENGETRQAWEHIAQLGDGRYFQVGQNGSAVAIATPYDARLAELSRALDATRLAYGTAEQQAAEQRKFDAADKLHAAASVASRARRAMFNASGSGAANLLGEHELVDDVASGRVDLSAIEPDRLPAPMQAMDLDQRKAAIGAAAERRGELQRQIRELAGKRSEFLKHKVDEAGGAAGSLDEGIYHAIRDQAGKSGLHYEAGAPAY